MGPTFRTSAAKYDRDLLIESVLDAVAADRRRLPPGGRRHGSRQVLTGVVKRESAMELTIVDAEGGPPDRPQDRDRARKSPTSTSMMPGGLAAGISPESLPIWSRISRRSVPPVKARRAAATLARSRCRPGFVS